MATRIEGPDIEKVFDLLVLVEGPNGKERHERYRHHFYTNDGWRVHISGWNHAEGWSRSFLIVDALAEPAGPRRRGYVDAKHDGGRYDGRDWHRRMADDILEMLKELRRSKEEE